MIRWVRSTYFFFWICRFLISRKKKKNYIYLAIQETIYHYSLYYKNLQFYFLNFSLTLLLVIIRMKLIRLKFKKFEIIHFRINFLLLESKVESKESKSPLSDLNR